MIKWRGRKIRQNRIKRKKGDKNGWGGMLVTRKKEIQKAKIRRERRKETMIREGRTERIERPGVMTAVSAMRMITMGEDDKRRKEMKISGEYKIRRGWK